MKTFNSIISRALRITLLFLLAFIWIRFYEKTLWLAVIYSALITIGIDVLLTLLISKNDARVGMKNAEMKKAEGYANYFIFNDKSVAIKFFYKLFSTQFQVNKRTHFLFWQNKDDIIAFVPVFCYGEVKISDIISSYNAIKLSQQPTKVIFCGATFAKDTITFAKDLPIKIMLFDQYNAYEKLMKPTNIFPEETMHFNNSSKPKWRDVFEIAFNRKHTKAWLLSSFILIFSSFFVKVSIYYLIISSILLIFAIISLCFSSKKNNIIEENIFN